MSFDLPQNEIALTIQIEMKMHLLCIRLEFIPAISISMRISDSVNAVNKWFDSCAFLFRSPSNRTSNKMWMRLSVINKLISIQITFLSPSCDSFIRWAHCLRLKWIDSNTFFFSIFFLFACRCFLSFRFLCTSSLFFFGL